MQPVDTHGFEKEADKSERGASLMREPAKEKLFYETAKFNPRSLIDLVENAPSSCNEATEEAHGSLATRMFHSFIIPEKYLQAT